MCPPKPPKPQAPGAPPAPAAMGADSLRIGPAGDEGSSRLKGAIGRLKLRTTPAARV
jgi:hypothetical protein